MSTPDLVTRMADPGFTPGIRLLGDLLELVATADDAVARSAERAVLRIEVQYAARVASGVVARARSAEHAARATLTHLAGRLAQEKRDPEGAATEWLFEALGDADAKTRRAAARGLGKLERSTAIEEALAKAFDREPNGPNKQAIALALGKVGGEAARTRLAGGEHGRATVIADRELARSTAAGIDPSRAHGGALPIWFHVRSGLEALLEEELGTSFGRPRFVAPGIVEAHLEGPLAKALAVRLAMHVGFPLEPRTKGKDLATDIVTILATRAARAILRAFAGDGPIRFRLEFLRGGHRRAVAWRVAELVRTQVPELVNDPRSSPYAVVVDDAASTVKVEIVPRGFEDTRFAYRRDLVAASSHPTIAAAIARMAPRRDDDVVWDPFVGAGAELIERAHLGPFERLVGTDVEAGAIAAAKANLERAEVTASLVQESALDHRPRGVTSILTNPPMGRRVQRGTHADLLERFVAHAADVLVPGGSLVWIVPEPRQIRERAAQAGLRLARACSVDMGGFSAELAVYVKRERPRTARSG